MRYIFTSEELLGLGDQQGPGSRDLVERCVEWGREKVRGSGKISRGEWSLKESSQGARSHAKHVADIISSTPHLSMR